MTSSPPTHLLLILALAVAGCRGASDPRRGPDPHPGKVPLAEFRKLLAGFGNRFEIVVSDMADEIIAAEDGELARKALLLTVALSLHRGLGVFWLLLMLGYRALLGRTRHL